MTFDTKFELILTTQNPEIVKEFLEDEDEKIKRLAQKRFEDLSKEMKPKKGFYERFVNGVISMTPAKLSNKDIIVFILLFTNMITVGWVMEAVQQGCLK